jgi:kynureninase
VSDIRNIFSDNPDISLILIEGVSYLTGQVFPLKVISEIAHQNNAYIGVDLAHSVGNIALNLSDHDIDFAVWCSYKYLNGGPGAIAGCYINKKHHAKQWPRLGGWWGNDPNTRFEAFNNKHFQPYPSADGWQLSNPSIFSCAPLRAALDLFNEVNLDLLFKKTHKLTSYLRYLIESKLVMHNIEIITPHNNKPNGSQLSLKILNANFFRLVSDYSEQFDNFIFDTRKPNIVRLAPVPLYNQYDEIWQLVDYLASFRETL